MGKAKVARAKSIEDTLAEARNVAAAAKRNMERFKQADAKKKLKRVTPATITSLTTAIASFKKARAKHGGKRTASKTQSAAEAKARAPLATELSSIRADIETSYEEDSGIQDAAGRGLDFQTKSSKELLAHAEHVTSSLGEDPDSAKKAADAGVDKKRLAKITSLAAGLTLAKDGHTQTSDDASALGKEERALLRSIDKQTKHVRKTANAIFKNEPTIRAQFAPIARKHAVRARTAPPEQSQIISKSAADVTKQASS